jgi:hypothetical protein
VKGRDAGEAVGFHGLLILCSACLFFVRLAYHCFFKDVHGAFFIKMRRTVWIQSRYRTNKGGKEVMLIIVLKIPFSSE